MMSRLYKLLIFFYLMPVLSFAQEEIDYEDDINPYVLGDSIEMIVPLFLDFFKQNSEHPAVNIQLALIYEQRYQAANPLSEYASAMKNAQSAKMFFGRSRALIDDREVRRNAWYYPNFTRVFKRNGKPEVEFDSVRVVFERGLSRADSFLLHVPEIQQNFLKMVEQYDLATKTFVRINGDYNSLKDIYLLYGEKLSDRFDLLANSYDSTLYYYNQYLAAAAKYKYFTPNQKLGFRKITTYRLDGLVIQTDFLADDILLWDYKAWIDEVREVIEKDIKQLRSDIAKIENKLNSAYSQLDKWNSGDTINLDPINSKEIYKIRKYEVNSPVANLFDYKEGKINLIYLQKNMVVNDTLPGVSEGLKFFSMNKVLKTALELRKELEKYNTLLPSADLEKNKEFYQEFYNGTEGLRSYFQAEEKWMLNSIDKTAELIKEEIINVKKAPYKRDSLVYNKLNLVWGQPGVKIDSMPSNTVAINYTETNFNKVEYLAGNFINTDSIMKAFYAGYSGGKINWYNLINVGNPPMKVYQEIGDIGLTGGGDLNILLYERNLDSLNFTNRILKVDEKGKILNDLKIAIQEKPIEVIGLRNSSLQLALFQGDGFPSAIWPNELTLVKFHPDSSNYLIKEIEINGKFLGVFETAKGITIASGSKDQKTISLTQIDRDLTIIDKKTLQFKEAMNISFSYQVSDDCLNLVSNEGEKGHLIFSDQLEVIYSDTALMEAEL